MACILFLRPERWNLFIDIFQERYKNYGKGNQSTYLLWDPVSIVVVQIHQCIYLTKILIQKPLSSLLPKDYLMLIKQDAKTLMVIMVNGDIILVMSEG